MGRRLSFNGASNLENSVFKAEKGESMTTYTIGDWTVSDLIADTIAAPKNISVPDLDYLVDYTKVSDEATEASIANTTGPDLLSHESIRFARSEVANVYAGSVSDSALMLPQKKGVQVMAELRNTYRAANSVSGNEYDLPCVARVVLRFPAFTCVTKDLVKDLLMRTIAASFGTGSTTESRIMDMAMGSLLPN